MSRFSLPSILPTCGLVMLVHLFTVFGFAGAEPWPQWRGALGTGYSAEKGLPVQWNEQQDILWKVPLPGLSAATPAIWGDHIFVSSPNEAGDLALLAFNRQGKLVWQRKVGAGNHTQGWNDKNNMATPSPVTDGKHVWILTGTTDLHCYDFQGNLRWKRNLADDHGPVTSDFGLGCSPLLYQDKLFFACIHQRAPSYVLAIDKNTGKDAWKVFRPTDAQAESRDAYSTPSVFSYPDGRAELILCAADVVTAYDAKTGQETWRHGDINLTGNTTLRIIVTPVVTKDLIYATSAKGGPVHAIRPGGAGDVTASHRKWTMLKNTPDISSPAVHDDLFFMCEKNGIVTCLDAKSGQVHWTQRIKSGLYSASPVIADGKVYLHNERGDVTVLAESKSFEVLGTSELGDFIMASPAISDGQIFYRTEKYLVCVGSE